MDHGTDFEALLPAGGLDVFQCLIDSSCNMLGLEADIDTQWVLVKLQGLPAFLHPTTAPKFRSGPIRSAVLPPATTGMVVTAFALESMGHSQHTNLIQLRRYVDNLYQCAANSSLAAKQFITELGKEVFTDAAVKTGSSYSRGDMGPAASEQCSFFGFQTLGNIG